MARLRRAAQTQIPGLAMAEAMPFKSAEQIRELFAREIRQLLLESGKSIAEISNRTDVRQAMIYDLMEGVRLPPTSMLDSLLQACDASPGQIRYVLQIRQLLRNFGEPYIPIHSGAGVINAGLESVMPAQKLREDVEGYDDLKPDPLAATTKEEFLQCMRDFHIWAKELSYREIARRSGRAIGASTLCEALNPQKPPRLPSMKVVEAFITGCGGSEDEQDRWTTAWRRIRMAKTRSNVTSLPTSRTAS